MGIESTVSAENSADEMDELEKLLERLKTYRWLLAAIILVFLVLVSTDRLSALAALVCALVLGAAILMAPQKNAKAQAKEAIVDEAELQHKALAFLDVIPDPVMLIGQSGNIQFTNPEFVAAFGATQNGSSSLLRFRSPEIQNFIQLVINGDKAEPIEYAETKPISRWFSVTARAVEDNNLKQLYLIHFHDLSETKHTERVRSDFIANASHELRTPLASLTGFIETLAGSARNDEEARDRFLKIMQDQAERMSRLIDDLLTLSRIETGKGRSQFAKVDVRNALRHVIDALRPMAQNANTSIDAQIGDDSESVFVHGSGDELIQLFENLLENAIKYGGENGKVEIVLSAPADNGDIAIEFRDSGPGIPEEHIPRLVERFYRVDVETSRGKQGTGLGLSIVRHIAQRHGGRLNIRSEIGQGSTFIVTLPFAPEETLHI